MLSLFSGKEQSGACWSEMHIVQARTFPSFIISNSPDYIQQLKLFLSYFLKKISDDDLMWWLGRQMGSLHLCCNIPASLPIPGPY